MRCSSLALCVQIVLPGVLVAQAPAALDARLSPDGRMLAVRALDAGSPRLYVMAVADSLSNAAPLTPPGTRVDTYEWAPDGRALVFRSPDDGHLYVVTADSAGTAGPPRDLTPRTGGPAGLAGPAPEAGTALVALSDSLPDRPDLYRVDLATGVRTRIATNDGGITRWVVDNSGAVRFAVRAGEDGSEEVVRLRDDDFVPIYGCAPDDICDPLAVHPDGRLWLRSSRNRAAPALVLLDPLTLEETVVRANLAGDPGAVFPSDSLFLRDVGRLREDLGDVALAFQPPIANGSRMLVTATDSTSTLYLFDRWAGTVTRLFSLASDAGEEAGPAMDESGPRPDPSVLRPVRLRYSVREDDPTIPPTDVERRIEQRAVGGRDVWRVIDAGEVPVFGMIPLDTAQLLADPTADMEPALPDPGAPDDMVEAADTVLLDALTLRPVRRRAGGPFRARLDFSDRRVTGTLESAGFADEVNVEAAAPLWADGSALEVAVAALPLSNALTTRLLVFYSEALDTTSVSIRVEGEEETRVPAGTFMTWRLSVTPRGEVGLPQEWLVRRSAPHYLVRSTVRVDDFVRITELTDAGGLR